MPIFRFIANARTKNLFGKLSQPQNEALIDALAFAKIVDGEIAPEERRELEEAMEMLSWVGAFSIEQHIEQAIGRARAVKLDPEQTATYLSDISERLGEQWLREEAYHISALIALSDRVVVEKERALLESMVTRFNIDPERLVLITRKLIREAESM
jgi:tellurite resistance protein